MTAWFLFNQVIHIAYLNTQGFFWRWQASNFSVLSSHPFPQNCSNPSEILPFPELDVNSANSVSSVPLFPLRSSKLEYIPGAISLGNTKGRRQEFRIRIMNFRPRFSSALTCSSPPSYLLRLCCLAYLTVSHLFIWYSGSSDISPVPMACPSCLNSTSMYLYNFCTFCLNLIISFLPAPRLPPNYFTVNWSNLIACL